jgi:hypothetical protein
MLFDTYGTYQTKELETYQGLPAGKHAIEEDLEEEQEQGPEEIEVEEEEEEEDESEDAEAAAGLRAVPSKAYSRGLDEPEQFGATFPSAQYSFAGTEEMTAKTLGYTEMGLFLPSSQSHEMRHKRMVVFDCLLSEVAKVNNFYLQQEEELASKLSALLSETQGGVQYPAPTRSLSSFTSRSLSGQALDQYGNRGLDQYGNGLIEPAPHGSDSSSDGSVYGSGKSGGSKGFGSTSPKSTGEERHKQRFYDIFAGLHKIMSFAQLNFTGFDKVIKAFDKLAGCNSRRSFRVAVGRKEFHSSPLVREIYDKTIEAFAQQYCGGNTGEADYLLLQQLRRVHDDELAHRTGLVLGAKFGITFGMMLMIAYRIATMQVSFADLVGPYSRGIQPIYQAFACVCVLAWLWGLSLLTWARYQINHIFIFEFDPENYLSSQDMLEQAAHVTAVFCANLLLFLSHMQLINAMPDFLAFSPVFYPIALLLYLLHKVIFPPEVFRSSRNILLQSISMVLRSPFGRRRFRDEFTGSVMTSMAKVMLDLVYGVVFYVYLGVSCLFGFEADGWVSLPYFKYKDLPGFERLVVPLVIAVPLIARMLQTAQAAWEERDATMLLNTVKYLLATFLLALGAIEPLCSNRAEPMWAPLDMAAKEVRDLTPIPVPRIHLAWLMTAIVLTLYSAWWDTKKDWGLLTNYKSHTSAGWLRPHLMFYRPWLYYFAIIINVPLRFNWCLSFTPFDWASWEQTFIVPLILVVELARRAVWGILSVENQHVQGRRGGKDKEVAKNDDPEAAGGSIPIFFDAQEAGGERESRYDTGTLASMLKEVGIMLLFVGVLVVCGRLTMFVHTMLPGDIHNPTKKAKHIAKHLLKL